MKAKKFLKVIKTMCATTPCEDCPLGHCKICLMATEGIVPAVDWDIDEIVRIAKGYQKGV